VIRSLHLGALNITNAPVHVPDKSGLLLMGTEIFRNRTMVLDFQRMKLWISRQTGRTDLVSGSTAAEPSDSPTGSSYSRTAPFAHRQASVAPALPQAQHRAVTPAAFCRFAATPLRPKTTMVVTSLRAIGGWRRAQPSALPASRLPVLCALRKMVMRAQSTVSRAARRWHTLVGVRWLRLQSRIAAAYTQRVTQPVQLWWRSVVRRTGVRSCRGGKSIVWHYLHITGWVRASRRPACLV